MIIYIRLTISISTLQYQSTLFGLLSAGGMTTTLEIVSFEVGTMSRDVGLEGLIHGQVCNEIEPSLEDSLLQCPDARDPISKKRTRYVN